MPITRAPAVRRPSSPPAQSSRERAPEQASPVAPDPAGQSPDAPIEFRSDTDVGRGNSERANAEPEPAALHDAQAPGTPDVAAHRRDVAKHQPT